MSLLPPMLQDSDWKVRRAGLHALALIGEGCKKALRPLLVSVGECGGGAAVGDVYPMYYRATIYLSGASFSFWAVG